MKSIFTRLWLSVLLWSFPLAATFTPCSIQAQTYNPDANELLAQRNALISVRAEADWLQNAARVAPDYGAGGYGMLWWQFQYLRSAYAAFKATLTPAQLEAGAADLAELDAGLDIIQDGFADFETKGWTGNTSISFRKLCQAMNLAVSLWSREFSARLPR